MRVQTKLPKVGTTIFTVMSQMAMQHQAVNLGQGFPDFPVPEALIDSLSKAMREGKNQYAPMMGILPLREAIAAKTEACYGFSACPDSDITVTSGASEAIFDAVLAVVRPGDEVIVLDPCYDCYEPAIDLAGGICVHVPLNPSDFSVDWALLAAAVTAKTRMIFINSPHNPSGALWSDEDMQKLIALIRGKDIIVLSDEVYEHIIFGGVRHQSALLYPELAEKSFVISSFGKTYHCTGWKIGYCIAPKALTAEFRKVHQYNTFCSFAPAQWAFAEMIRQQPTHYAELGAFYQSKRDYFAGQLARTRFKALPVPGGYFQLVDYSAISDRSDADFARWLCVEKGVAAIPLSPFYAAPPEGQRLIRLCFAKNPETLDAAIARLEQV
jgi:methionine aminotransferase